MCTTHAWWRHARENRQISILSLSRLIYREGQMCFCFCFFVFSFCLPGREYTRSWRGWELSLSQSRWRQPSSRNTAKKKKKRKERRKTDRKERKARRRKVKGERKVRERKEERREEEADEEGRKTQCLSSSSCTQTEDQELPYEPLTHQTYRDI